MPSLTDIQFESIRRRINSAIHEIVFACKHAEDDHLADASDCLVTAQITLDQVAQEIVDIQDQEQP
jgi:hypothetical protein